MVRSGWALLFLRYSHEYNEDEIAASRHACWALVWILHRAVGTGGTVIRQLSSSAQRPWPVNAQAILLGDVSALNA
jgi:hypothetical protein